METTILHFAQLAAGDGEDTFWIQLLVMVILGAGVGIFGVLKKHKKRYGSAGTFARHFLDTIRRRISGLGLPEKFRRLWSQLSEAALTLLRAISSMQMKLRKGHSSGDEAIQQFGAELTAEGLVDTGVPVETAPSEFKNNVGAGQTRATTRVAPTRRGGRDFKGGMELLTSDFLVEIVERTESVETHDIAMRNLCFCELVRRNELRAVSSDALKAYTLNTEDAFDKSIRYQAMRELAHRTEQKRP